MLWTVAGAKGGVGTSVIASALAIEQASSSSEPVTLVDLAGDQADLLAVDASLPGVWDWMAAGSDVDGAALNRLAIDVTDRLRLIPAGEQRRANIDADRIAALAGVLDEHGPMVIVDVGVAGSDPVGPTNLLMASADRRTAVVRPCYLALRRMQRIAVALDDVVEIREGGRALSTIDIEAVVGQPVTARVPFDPAIARAVDAGLLHRRLPRPLRRAARDLLIEAELDRRQAA